MLLPNKLCTYQESSLPYFIVILGELKNGPMIPSVLYKRAMKKDKRIELMEFVEVLDSLFALGRIELDSITGVLKYVD